MHLSWLAPLVGILLPFAFLTALAIFIAQQFKQAHWRRLQSEERLAAIARGLPVPVEPISESASSEPPRRNRARALRAVATVFTSLGIGNTIFALLLVWIFQKRDILALAAVSVVPLAIGIGLFIEYRLQTRELEQLPTESRSTAP